MTDIVKKPNEITITIPLTITISLGMQQISIPVDAPSVEATATPASRFSLAALAQNAFSWPAALSCALASKLSYSAADVVEGQQSWGFQSIKFLHAVDTQCFVAVGDQVVLVAFRGTENAADWMADFNAFFTVRPYGNIHRGFYHAFNDIRPALEAALPKMQNRKLILTGHSLGGALATVAAAEWHTSGAFKPSAVVTFGQPRVGFSSLKTFIANKFGDRYSRFVNDTDIVTRVPPGYSHVGKLYHFSPSGQLQETLGTARAAQVDEAEPPALTNAQFDELRADLLKARHGLPQNGHSESMAQAAEMEGIVPGVQNHAIDNYIDLISRQF